MFVSFNCTPTFRNPSSLFPALISTVYLHSRIGWFLASSYRLPVNIPPLCPRSLTHALLSTFSGFCSHLITSARDVPAQEHEFQKVARRRPAGSMNEIEEDGEAFLCAANNRIENEVQLTMRNSSTSTTAQLRTMTTGTRHWMILRDKMQ